MAVSIATGFALVVGAVLVVAGVLKVGALEQFAATLGTLLPAGGPARRSTRVAAPVIAAAEIAVGAALPFAPGGAGVAVAVIALALTIAFTAVIARAIVVGAPCSCFGSLGRTRAGGRELGRAEGLTLLCTAIVVLRAAGRDAGAFGAPAVVIVAAAGAAGLLGLVALLGARLVPVRGSDAPATLAGPDEVRALVAAVRASSDARVLLAHLAQAGCRPPRWREASGARVPARAQGDPPQLVVRIPTEGGCTLTAFARPRGADPLVVACHNGRCALVSEGRVVAGAAAPAIAGL